MTCVIQILLRNDYIRNKVAYQLQKDFGMTLLGITYLKIMCMA